MEKQKITTSPLSEKTKNFAKKSLEKYDSSHDFFHAIRVGNMAIEISIHEGITNIKELELIYIAALLHDVCDAKYNGSEDDIQQFLKDKLCKANISKVMDMIRFCSFSKGLLGNQKLTLNQKIVKDADQLDAIGAIGVARCLIYSGAKNQVSPFLSNNF